MSNLMKCYKCSTNESLLYICCKQSQPHCYSCTKKYNCTCGKKINKPYNPNSRSAIKVSKIITCQSCKEIIDQLKDFVTFPCDHYFCQSCTCKAVQTKLRYQSWQYDQRRGDSEKSLECACWSRKRKDISSFLNNHCLCCGDSFVYDKKVHLKYGLVIRQSCRRKILYEQNPQAILKGDDIIKITKTCKSCSNVIDGEDRTVGIEKFGDYQCSNCYNRVKGIKQEPKDTIQSCVSCDRKFSTFNMVMCDGFYLCSSCHLSFKQKEEQGKNNKKQSKQMVHEKKPSLNAYNPVIKKTSKCISCDKQFIKDDADQEKISCDQCIKQHLEFVQELSKKKSKEDRPVSSASIRGQAKDPPESPSIQKKSKLGINLEQQIKTDLKKKPSYEEPASNNCLNCGHYFKYQVSNIESELSSVLCSKCINENQSLPAKRSLSQPHPPLIQKKNDQLKYRSPQQLQNWRKVSNCKQFLASRQILKFNPLVAGELRVEGKQNKPKAQRGEDREVMYSVIQEFPDKDLLDIAPPYPRTVNCGQCGYNLSKEHAVEYKAWNGKQQQLCLNCFVTCQAKNV